MFGHFVGAREKSHFFLLIQGIFQISAAPFRYNAVQLSIPVEEFIRFIEMPKKQQICFHFSLNPDCLFYQFLLYVSLFSMCYANENC